MSYFKSTQMRNAVLSAFILEQAARERQKQIQKQSPPSDEKQT